MAFRFKLERNRIGAFVQLEMRRHEKGVVLKLSNPRNSGLVDLVLSDRELNDLKTAIEFFQKGLDKEL